MRTLYTVSRYAFRILCARSSPYAASVFAAGFDPLEQIFVGPEAPKRLDGRDAFTTFGCLIYKPEYGQWYELSVMGLLYPLRQAGMPNVPRDTRQPVPALNNTLTDGTMIDICGATFIWRAPTASPEPRHQFRREFNARVLYCPVMYDQIGVASFSTATPTYTATSSAPVVAALVFPRCGHVYGESEGMLTLTRCPLCRTDGPCVRLGVIDTIPHISGVPEAVFNPCGHATSRAIADAWAATSIPRAVFDVKDRISIVSCCPFCRTELAVPPIQKLFVESPASE